MENSFLSKDSLKARKRKISSNNLIFYLLFRQKMSEKTPREENLEGDWKHFE